MKSRMSCRPKFAVASSLDLALVGIGEEMQNHTLRNWFAEFSPSPVRGQSSYAPDSR